MELTQTPTILFSGELTQIGGKNYLCEPFFQIYATNSFPFNFQFVLSVIIPGIKAEDGETLEVKVEFVNKSTNETLFSSEKIPFEVKEPLNSLTLNFDKVIVPIAQAGIYEARLSINDKVVATSELSAQESRKIEIA